MCRPDILLSIYLTFKLVRRGLLACLPATLLIFTDRPSLFWWKGLFFSSGPFPWLICEAFLAACIVFPFLYFLFFEKGNQRQSDLARHAKCKGPPQKRAGKSMLALEYKAVRYYSLCELGKALNEKQEWFSQSAECKTSSGKVLGYIAVFAERGQQSWSLEGLWPEPSLVRRSYQYEAIICKLEVLV